MKNNEIMTLIYLDYHWQQHFWNIWKIAYIPIIFQALCGPWILDRSTALRDVEAPGAGGKYFQPQHLSFGCETW